MKIAEADRERLMRELEGANQGLWVEIASEIQQFGKELAVWVLIDDNRKIAKAFAVFIEKSRPYREKFQETDFSISFDQFKDGKILKWNFVTPKEIRTGCMDFRLGEDYEVFELTGTVFSALRKYVK